MKKKLILVLIILSSLTISVKSKEPEWLEKMKQIKILSDTREDVLKLLGKPYDGDINSPIWFYHLDHETQEIEEGTLKVLYSFDSCESVGVTGGLVYTGWKVPKWTVVKVSFSPSYDGVKPKELKIKNFKGFRSVPENDFPEMVVYKNDELGIDYTIYEKKITNITFRGTKKQVQNLACNEEDVKLNSMSESNR